MSNVEATVSSPELVLLQMIIENDHQQSEADKAARDSARKAQLEAMKDELEALSEQADAIRTGALVEGGLQAAGGVMSAQGTVTCDAAQVREGELCSKLAVPAGDLLGRAPEADAAHDAEAAAQEQEQASWIAEDAEEHRQQVEQRAETMLQQVQGILETQHQTTLAVIANV